MLLLRRIATRGITVRRIGSCLDGKSDGRLLRVSIGPSGVTRCSHKHHTNFVSNSFHSSSVCTGKVVPFKLSDIGEGIAEVQVIEWFVKEGDTVAQFDNICEVQSDKASVVITSRYDGVITKLYYSVDDIAKVGNPLVDIEVTGEDQDSSAGSSDEEEIPLAAVPRPVEDGSGDPAPRAGSRALATPAVRRIAADHNVDLSTVTGTGKDGRVTKEDVLKHLSPQGASTVSVDVPLTTPAVSTTPTGKAKVTIATEDQTVPIKGYKRTMAKTMTESGRIPQFGYCDEINMSALFKLRQEMQKEFEQSNIKFTYMPVLIKALSHALTSYPMLNSHAASDASTVTYKASHNIGVAIDTQDGLVVPNIKSVQTKTIMEVLAELNRLTELAHLGKLGPSDITGGTFTLSNIGAVGGTYARPLLLPPEVAIGAFGRAQVVPRYTAEGQLEPAHVMHVSWSADHRVIDGATMSRFSNLWRSLVENPARLVLELK